MGDRIVGAEQHNRAPKSEHSGVEHRAKHVARLEIGGLFRGKNRRALLVFAHLDRARDTDGDDQHRAGKLAKVLFQPGGGLRVQMVGGFVQQQQVRLAQEQLAQGHPPFFTPRKIFYAAVRRRAPQGLHGHFDLGIEIP